MGKRKNHLPEQIVRKLQTADGLAVSGSTVEQIARELGVAVPTYYSWRKQYDSMTVDEAKELKRLRDENRQLKMLVAEKELEKQAYQILAEGNF